MWGLIGRGIAGAAKAWQAYKKAKAAGGVIKVIAPKVKAAGRIVKDVGSRVINSKPAKVIGTVGGGVGVAVGGKQLYDANGLYDQMQAANKEVEPLRKKDPSTLTIAEKRKILEADKLTNAFRKELIQGGSGMAFAAGFPGFVAGVTGLAADNYFDDSEDLERREAELAKLEQEEAKKAQATEEKKSEEVIRPKSDPAPARTDEAPVTNGQPVIPPKGAASSDPAADTAAQYVRDQGNIAKVSPQGGPNGAVKPVEATVDWSGRVHRSINGREIDSTDTVARNDYRNQEQKRRSAEARQYLDDRRAEDSARWRAGVERRRVQEEQFRSNMRDLRVKRGEYGGRDDWEYLGGQQVGKDGNPAEVAPEWKKGGKEYDAAYKALIDRYKKEIAPLEKDGWLGNTDAMHDFTKLVTRTNRDGGLSQRQFEFLNKYFDNVVDRGNAKRGEIQGRVDQVNRDAVARLRTKYGMDDPSFSDDDVRQYDAGQREGAVKKILTDWLTQRGDQLMARWAGVNVPGNLLDLGLDPNTARNVNDGTRRDATESLGDVAAQGVRLQRIRQLQEAGVYLGPTFREAMKDPAYRKMYMEAAGNLRKSGMKFSSMTPDEDGNVKATPGDGALQAVKDNLALRYLMKQHGITPDPNSAFGKELARRERVSSGLLNVGERISEMQESQRRQEAEAELRAELMDTKNDPAPQAALEPPAALEPSASSLLPDVAAEADQTPEVVKPVQTRTLDDVRAEGEAARNIVLNPKPEGPKGKSDLEKMADNIEVEIPGDDGPEEVPDLPVSNAPNVPVDNVSTNNVEAMRAPFAVEAPPPEPREPPQLRAAPTTASKGGNSRTRRLHRIRGRAKGGRR